MRFLYVDESGRSPDKDYLVVVGLLVNADTQWQPLAASAVALRSVVPERFREGFEFHASEIWGADKYRKIDENGVELWPAAERVNYLCSMMVLPRMLGIPIFFSMHRRRKDGLVWGQGFPSSLKGRSAEDHLHAIAFGGCVLAADQYLMKYAKPSEISIIVAENVQGLQDVLRETVALMVHKPFQVPMQNEKNENISAEFRIRTFVDTVYYAQKNGSIILEVVDACAYGLYRFFQQKYALDDQFGEAILGTDKASMIRARSYNLNTIGSYCSRREPPFKEPTPPVVTYRVDDPSGSGS